MENMDWGALGFDYRKTDANVRYYYTDGKWSDMEDHGRRVYQDTHVSVVSALRIELFKAESLRASMEKSVSSVSRKTPSALQSPGRAPLPSCPDDRDDCQLTVEVVKRNEKYTPLSMAPALRSICVPLCSARLPGLGVKPAKDALLIVYCSPVLISKMVSNLSPLP